MIFFRKLFKNFLAFTFGLLRCVCYRVLKYTLGVRRFRFYFYLFKNFFLEFFLEESKEKLF